MTKRSQMLDLLRWVSAFLVLIGHIRSILFEDFKSEHATIFHKFIYFITGFGSQAVFVFFVLSGYLVCQSILKQYRAKTFQLKNYTVNRLTRIYIVLIPALLFTLLFDSLGSWIDQEHIYTGSTVISSLKADPLSRLDVFHFITSLGMLQNITLPIYGSNGPLWSLNFEVIYYAIIPFIIGLFFIKEVKSIVIYIIIISLFLYLMPRFILLSMSIWLCGLLPIFIKKEYLFLKYGCLIGLSILLYISRTHVSTPVDNFFIALTVGLFISTVNDTEIIQNPTFIHKKLASFSYSLYLVHYPFCLFILVFVNRFVTPAIKIRMNIESLLIFALIILLTGAFARFIAYFTEDKTDFIRKKIA
ncbi:MAG: acyltransferase [Pedobacter sp.]|nr:MAG: acyltransferase [Pedobacter sp.]